jgi:hypothetical protein
MLHVQYIVSLDYSFTSQIWCLVGLVCASYCVLQQSFTSTWFSIMSCFLVTEELNCKTSKKKLQISENT